MLKGNAARILFVLGLIGGAFASRFVAPADAARNGSGTYSLPSGNPVVTGTAVNSTVHNATMADLAAETTNSLDRGGRGAMTAPLPLSNGTVANPALTFGTDADLGFYRIGANNIGLACGGSVKVMDCVATGCTYPLGIITTQSTAAGDGITTTGASSDGDGITATGGTSNGRGGVFTGDGTGAGAACTGGDSSGPGVLALGGAPNGNGVTSTGDGSGRGGYFTGGDSDGAGVVGIGGASNGNGGEFAGTGTGVAVRVGAGHEKFIGSNPAATTGFTNTNTPMNLVKAWARVTTDGIGNSTLAAGFNVASVSISTSTLTVSIADDLAGANGIVIVTGRDTVGEGYSCSGILATAGTATVRCAITVTPVDFAAQATQLSVLILGAQ